MVSIFPSPIDDSPINSSNNPRTGIVAAGHTAATAGSTLTGLGGGSLLGSITLANAGSGTVDSLGGRRRGSIGVELGVIACKAKELEN
jgi:hypothetical protein